MTTFQNVDVLTITPNAVSQWGATISRPLEPFGVPTGNVVTPTTGAPPGNAFTLTWHCATRADLLALTAFLDARLGQTVPCWISTYTKDLDVVVKALFAGWTVRTRVNLDLVALVNSNAAWHFWYVLAPGGQAYRMVHAPAATDLGGGTAKIAGPSGDFSSSGTANLSLTSADGAVFSRAMRCRMATDSYKVSFLGAVSTVEASFVEVAGDL